MKIYTSYPITGHKGWREDAVKMVAGLRKSYPDHQFVVPHEIMHAPDGAGHLNPDYSHADYVREDIKKGLLGCDAIALKNGWVYSLGCRDEFNFSAILGLRVFHIIEFTTTKSTEGDLEYYVSPLLTAIDGKGSL